MVTLGAALNAAVESGLIPRNPAGRVKKPKQEKTKVRPYDADEVRKLLAAAEGRRLAAWFHLAVDSGLRPGESLALHYYDIDFDAGLVRVERSLEEIRGEFRLKPPKTKKSRRTVSLTPQTVGALRDHRELMRAEGRDVERGPLFVTQRRGGWWSKPTFYRRVYLPVLRKAKLRHLKPHGLRHTSATLLLSNGASVKMVSERLGHESVNITLEHYAHVLPTDQDQAVRLLGRLISRDENASKSVDSPTNVPQNAETLSGDSDSVSRMSA
jgi:integrase